MSFALIFSPFLTLMQFLRVSQWGYLIVLPSSALVSNYSRCQSSCLLLHFAAFGKCLTQIHEHQYPLLLLDEGSHSIYGFVHRSSFSKLFHMKVLHMKYSIYAQTFPVVSFMIFFLQFEGPSQLPLCLQIDATVQSIHSLDNASQLQA